jgi:hypothetical protein
MAERDIFSVNDRLATAEQTLLATVGYGVSSIIDAKSGLFYGGATIEVGQEAVYRLIAEGLVTLDNRYKLSITEAGKTTLVDRVESGSTIDQMAQLTAEYTQKMRTLGAQVVGSAQNVDV